LHFELTEEQLSIKKAVREFCEKEFKPELMLEFERKEEFPMELYKKAAKLGFTSMRFPEEYGGQGYGLLEDCLVVEELCRADPGVGAAIVSGTFASDIIYHFGTEEQKEKYLVPVCRGELISAGAFTEPAHGSDITRLDTIAVKSGGEFLINGTKTLITNAPIANFFGVLCQTDLEVTPSYRGQSYIIVDRDVPGVDVTPLKGKMGIRSTLLGEISFSNVRVPEENLVGELNKGFYYAMKFFDKSRIQIAAHAVGMAQGAFERAFNYAKKRTAFGSPIIQFQAIQLKLAEMATKIEAARLLTYKAAWLYDKGKVDPMTSSMAKAFAARAAVEVTDEAIQIHGGYGYLEDYHVERYHRCAKITDIYEGTTEIQKLNIARYLLKRM
jgi:alkylation response protein AidB-like acyl-CoA dehydrogenase